ncbi:non-ribosomal peptide synthetase [Myxosarcina sp. GI1]|uniref:non-ribosomal peptide synthetase n=1 Tax=Myxosarcina sp. GI1 TaxID=1541065 RepID=UPI00055E85D4|nr:non-ribosomal peptide synthetase [Myxosarcina sp. GI1]
MNLLLLLRTLLDKGVKLAADGDSLAVDAPKGVLSPELKNSLIEYKAEILKLLRQNKSNPTALPTIVPESDKRYEPFPLTDMQHAFWVGRSGVFELGNVANHGYYEIEGKNLDLDRLNTTLQRLIDRHDMLRAIVLPDGRQQVLKTVPTYEIPVLDLRDKEEPEVKTELAAIRDRLSHQVLPTDRFPLFEFRITLLDETRFRLHVSYDLQIFDAWSLFRLFDEWFQLYENPQIELEPLTISFRDYVLTEQKIQQTELYERSRDYWLNRLDSLPPAPDLPLAKRPSELKQHLCKRYAGRLESDRWQQLKQQATQAGLTPSGILLAAFTEILTIWSKSPKFTISLALFNRLPLHPQVNELLGDFISATLLEVDNSHPEPFNKRASSLQQQLWQDLEHRYFSGVRVTRELAKRKGTTPSAIPIVFTSTLGLENLGQETSTFSHFGKLVYGISQASQAWMDVQVWEEKGALTFNWDVVEELFPSGMIQDMFEAYCRLLEVMSAPLAPQSWGERINRELLLKHQLKQRSHINNTAAPISEEMLHTLFAAQVNKSKDEYAVISSQGNLTYQELYECSNQVAHKLRSLGVSPNQLVAVMMEKGWEQVVAVMGILTAGAAYVPIDPNLPEERRDYLLQNSQVSVVLTQSWFKEKLTNYQILCLEDVAEESKETLQPIQTPDDLAYLVYTSGSTGVPKGVMINHRGAVNTILDINRRFNVTPSDRVLALSSLSFDLSVYDIFGTLAAGGTIVIPDKHKERDPAHWNDAIAQYKVTIWNSVPALMQIMVDYAAENNVVLDSLRLVLLSGDWLPLTLPQQIQTLTKEAKVMSLGGATEASIWSILYPIEKVDPAWKSIPYGRPMINQQFHVIDRFLEPCPNWVAGELYIGGIGLAMGYWQNEAKTAASFIVHPQTGERLYRTGDLGCYLPDGNIEFLGREDFQVKIGGYRIELGEIEAVLTQHPAVDKAVVVVAGKNSKEQRLVAYAVVNEEISCNELRGFLKEKLSEYMIPSAFMYLEKLPLSANGKIDRNALPNPEILLQEFAIPYTPPQNAIEETLVSIWQTVLDLEQVGIDHNFFEIGGNSLLITQVYSKLKNQSGDNLETFSIVDLFKYPTIRSLAQYLQTQESTAESENPELIEQIAAGKNRLRQRLHKSKSVS